MTTIPVLTTDRLTLRAPGPQDFDAFAAFYATDHARHVGGPMEPWEVWRYLCDVIGHWTMRGFGRWMVETKDAPGRAIGLVGLHQPLDWPEREVGWYIWEGTRRGYAVEAGRAALDHAHGTLGWPTAISLISPGNDASVRTAERLGAVREADHRHPRFGPLIVYRHRAPTTPEGRREAPGTTPAAAGGVEAHSRPVGPASTGPGARRRPPRTASAVGGAGEGDRRPEAAR